ncbi:MAG: NUDIX hydrolase [Promethearchaeota archaeon]
MLKKWEKIMAEIMGRFKIFEVAKIVYENPYDNKQVPTFIVESKDWVNVIATREDGSIILIKQFRFGSGRIELEIPGGLVEPGEDPARAAERELKEETGNIGATPILIGKVNPNPAIHAHACYTFWIKNCRQVETPKFDGPNEKIEQVLKKPREILNLIKNGEITHSLVIVAFFWYFLATGSVNP